MNNKIAISVIASILLLGSIPFDSSFATNGILHEFKGLFPPIQFTDGFGFSISGSGNILAVGAHFDSEGATNTGAVFLYEKDQGGVDNWGQIKKITNPDPVNFDNFGRAVSLSGNILVVGAPFDDKDAQNANTGASYIFAKDQGGVDNWGLIKKITASDEAANNQFGISVSISGNTIAVGAEKIETTYIFAKDNGGVDNWGEVKKLTATDGTGVDSFGGSVSISGDVVVVGARNADGVIAKTGAAYIFAKDQGGVDNWGEVKKIFASDGGTGDFFGQAVSISNNRIVVGAPDDLCAFAASHGAYIFEKDEGGVDNWGQVIKLTPSVTQNGDCYGFAVSVLEDTVVVGAFLREVKSIDNTGNLYGYSKDLGGVDNWGETQMEFSFFNIGGLGNSVSIFDDIVAAGAERTPARGAAFLFDKTQLALDDDLDGIPNVSDNCIGVANPGQEDTDGDGEGDACNDANDSDGDEFSDPLDNCPNNFNPGQEDLDNDGIGDVCDTFCGKDFSAFDMVIQGTVSDDILTGTAGDDLILAKAGNDKVNGGDGDDCIFGELGFDILNGESGNDTIDGGLSNDHIDGGTGNDSITGGQGNDSLLGGSGDDTINGNDGTDTIQAAYDSIMPKALNINTENKITVFKSIHIGLEYQLDQCRCQIRYFRL